MKKIVSVCIVFLFFLIAVPMLVFVDYDQLLNKLNVPAFFGVVSSSADQAASATADNAKPQKSENKKTTDDIAAAKKDAANVLAAKLTPNMNDNALLALAVVINANIDAGVKYDKNNTDEFLSEAKQQELFSKKYENYKKRIDTIVKKSQNYKLVYSKKTVEVPILTKVNGATAASTNLPYLQAVASPWDNFAEETTAQAENTSENQSGISAAGIEHLTANGADFAQALLWYLPGFKIEVL
ncbi:MAG: hypothetical protein LBM65_07015 [Oscillospiraceae bacterium]|jgi:hypothetical protein|nr:hypothetical protein [Oscillospiraceae bacterium]